VSSGNRNMKPQNVIDVYRLQVCHILFSDINYLIKFHMLFLQIIWMMNL